MHAQGFFENNILQTLAYVEDAASNNTVYPLYIIQGVAIAITCAPACMHVCKRLLPFTSLPASSSLACFVVCMRHFKDCSLAHGISVL